MCRKGSVKPSYSVTRLTPGLDVDFEDDINIKPLRKLFKKQNIEIVKSVSCGDFHGTGGGSYWFFDLGFIQFIVSTLGKYLSFIEFTDEWNFDVVDIPKQQSDKLNNFLNFVVEDGYKILNPDLLKNIVPGLNVYFFGVRENLEIKDLVYYWQD